MHCFYFIYASKLYVRTHVKFMRQWKSTRRLVLHLGTWPWFLRSVIKYILNTSDNNPVFYWIIILPISARYIYHSRLRTTLLHSHIHSIQSILFTLVKIYTRQWKSTLIETRRMESTQSGPHLLWPWRNLDLLSVYEFITLPFIRFLKEHFLLGFPLYNLF